MGRLKLDVAFILFATVFVNCVVQSQYYVQPPQPIYYVQQNEPHPHQQNYHQSSQEEIIPQSQNQFMSRRGKLSSQEESTEESVEMPRRRKATPSGRSRPVKLPPNFDELVKRKMRVAQRPKRPLHGDPSPIHQDDDDDGRRQESRLLWPFSIEINKGKGGEGWGPGHYGSYTSWATNGWGDGAPPSTGWGSYAQPSHPYNGWTEKTKGLTDDEILSSKHYKKYQKKKKKKIKKLKKKLKFKRLIQKILQKHITYLDKIAPY